MSLVAKSQPNPADLLQSSLPSRASPLLLMSLVSTVESLRALSQGWKAMNEGGDLPSWRARWKRATSSLETLRELSEPSPI